MDGRDVLTPSFLCFREVEARPGLLETVAESGPWGERFVGNKWGFSGTVTPPA